MQDAQKPDDPVARLRERADNMATSAAALKKIADAADPLYKTLDDGQKRRLAILTHMEAGSAAEAGGTAASSAAWIAAATGIAATIGTATGTAATGAAPSGSERADPSIGPETSEKPPESGGFFAFRRSAEGRENPAGLLDIGGSLC